MSTTSHPRRTAPTDETTTSMDDVARALAAEAAARVEELDVERRLPADLNRRAAEAGLFRQLVPPAMGGTATTPLDWFRRGVEMARLDASFAWVVTQGSAEMAWIAVGGDPDWAAEVLADPLAASASTTAGAGSLRVDADGATGLLRGTWAFDTGCQGATWIGGLVIVDRSVMGGATAPAGGLELRIAWVPADQATIADDWDAIGLRGTGSHGIAIDQTIPLDWTVAWSEPTANAHGPFRVLVGHGNWMIGASVAAVQLGTARAALDELLRVAPTKAPAPDFVLLAANAAVQRRLFELEGMWLGAQAAVERELALLWDDAIAHEELSLERRIRLATVHAAANRAAVAVVDGAAELAGTEVTNRTARLSRCVRDVSALRGHIATNGTVLEHAAQLRFGTREASLLV